MTIFAKNWSMDILLVAATPFEIAGVYSWVKEHFQVDDEGIFSRNQLNIKILITGVGPVSTAWEMGRFLAQYRPDWAINAGIAGAFDLSLELGEVVHVTREQFADLGVEEADGRFTDLFELGLADANTMPFQAGFLNNPDRGQAAFLPSVNGLTVSKVHGHEASILAVRTKYSDAQVESMEGAAFFYACLQTGIPFMEIRAISNYVEPRNRAGWRLEEAMQNLNAVLIDILQILENQQV